MHIEGLWRHPVKSLQGEPVDSVLVTAVGVVGDRAWALRDVASGSILSAKREPRLLLASATVAGEGVAVAVPRQRDGRSPGADDEELSGWLGREVRIELSAQAPYVDEAHLHLIARRELGEWDVRRFRPNVVIDGADDLGELVGERLALGSTVVVEVIKRTKRCAMPTMEQPGIGRDREVLRTLARDRELRLGVYARVITVGALAVGAPVRVISVAGAG
ncbi:MAG: uncharacterized protein QOC82_1211 [Frankiaceae bacterium]|nr:uncharacterized protein [Frankiaceae bacterium]